MPAAWANYESKLKTSVFSASRMMADLLVPGGSENLPPFFYDPLASTCCTACRLRQNELPNQGQSTQSTRLPLGHSCPRHQDSPC